MILFKFCTSCKQEKPRNDFYNQLSTVDGLQYICIKCNKKRHKDEYPRYKTRLNKKSRDWYQENKEKARITRNKQQIKTAQAYKTTIKDLALGKIKTSGIVGCTSQEFRKYLENQFTTEMNWQNYGKKWQIKHIIPPKRFDLSIRENIYKLFHFSNLIPIAIIEIKV